MTADLDPTGGCAPGGPNPSNCPSTYTELDADGGACADIEEECVYPQMLCECVGNTGGAAFTDGGFFECSPQADWPFPRPRLGSPCTKLTGPCTYIPCALDETCQDGYWQGQERGSPG
jgi:hypothetical protein